MKCALVIIVTALSVSAQSITGGRPVVSEQLAHTSTDERVKTCEKLLAAKPGDLKLEIELTSAYLQKLRESADFTYLDRAAKLVDKMLETDGGNQVALRFQNEIDMQRHDFKSVADRAQDMLKYDPSDSGTWANLGDASIELGEYERAGASYIHMFALRANLASYNRLAWYRFVTGDAQTAITLMQQAVEAGDPAPEKTAWCWAELGDIYFKTGKLLQARSAYESALELFPRLHRAFAGLGRVSAAQSRRDDAIQHYLRAQAIVPLPEYAAALEDLYTAVGMPDKANQQRSMIATIEKLGQANNEKVNRNLALLLADHNRDLNVALTLIENELPTRGDVYTWDAYSWILLKNGRVAEAQAASSKALHLGTPEPVFYYHAEQIAKAVGDDKATHEYSARVAALNPNFDFTKIAIR